MAITKIKGSRAGAVPVPEYVNAAVATTITAENLSVPTDAGLVVLSVSAGAYVNFAGTAATPSDTSNGSASFYLHPGALYEFQLAKSDGTIPTNISFIPIAASSTVLTGAFYRNL